MARRASQEAADTRRAVASESAAGVRRSRTLLDELFGPAGERSFAVRYWNGDVDRPPGEPAFTLVLRRPDALRRMLLPPTERSLGEAYVRGDCDVRGDLEAAAGVFRHLLARPPPLRHLPGILLRLLSLPRPAAEEGTKLPERPSRRGRRHSRERDTRSVRYHYDAGNDFFDLWLDPYMQYSCGYFPSGRESLAEAQEAKLELLCDKLGLEPGHRLLDIGCGWGGLVRFAVERRGVRATGITLSEPQGRRARHDLEESGLADRCQVAIRGYREMASEEPFDRVVSVGMVEHVGRRRLGDYFRRVRRLLRPGGLFLNVGIVDLSPASDSPLRRATGRLLAPYTSFVDCYVFPDGELVAPSTRLRAAEGAGLEIRGAENYREHYAETLRRWVQRLEERRREAVRRTSEATYRIWRLYMAASAQAFESGRLGLLHGLYRRH